VSRPRPSLMPWEMTTGSMSTYATRASAATSRAAARASCPPWAARRRYRGTAGCPLPRPGTGRRGPGTPGSPAPGRDVGDRGDQPPSGFPGPRRSCPCRLASRHTSSR
jgi:hypothetical protein